MFRTNRRHGWGCVACLLAVIAGAAEKKMIGHSWDLLAVRPGDVARNLDAWEQVPLDGISLALVKTLPDGGKVYYGSVMTDPPWDRQWFAEDVQTLRQCASRTLKHNFLTTFWAPRERLPWDDDQAWERFAHNIGVVAWLAKEGGAKGILIDPEDYPQTRQYFWRAGDAPYAETAVRARRRGAQVMQGIAAEYPDATLLFFWMLSLHPEYFADHDPRAAVAEAGDLWPAFLNGMLDALPPGARMVDGNEHGYRYEAAKKDFYVSAWRMQNQALGLVESGNRVKYQTQVSAGFGLYLDMYTNPSNSPWFFGEQGGSRLNHLRSNFSQALDVAQDYVWVYGEKMDWIKWAGTVREKNPTWEEKLPGFSDTLDRLRDPRRWAGRMIERRRQAGTLENLAGDGSFASALADGQTGFRKGGMPPKWWFWRQDKKRPGEFGTDSQKGKTDSASLCAVGVEEGCFGVSAPAKPGKMFVVKADAQGAAPTLKVHWKRNGAWDWSLRGSAFRFGEAGDDGWRHAFGLVSVPEGADELVMMLGVRQAEGDRTWFDDVGLYGVSD